MSDRPSIVVEGKSYELVWGNLARVRYSGIAAEVRGLGGVVPMATMLWAAFVAKPHPYPSWEHLAEHLSPESLDGYSAALEQALPKVQDDAKKESAESGPSLGSPSA